MRTGRREARRLRCGRRGTCGSRASTPALQAGPQLVRSGAKGTRQSAQDGQLRSTPPSGRWRGHDRFGLAVRSLSPSPLAPRASTALAPTPPPRMACLPAICSFTGPLLAKHRGIMRVTRPIRAGAVENWDDMQTLWSQAVTQPATGLGVAFNEQPLLVTEPALTPRAQRNRMAELAFEALAAPALCVASQATLALYGSGRTTGVVLDVGDGATQVVPVYEGMALSHAVVRSDLAGRAVTHRLSHRLRASGLVLDGAPTAEVVREMKEAVCEVALDPVAAERAARARGAGAAATGAAAAGAAAAGAAGSGGEGSTFGCGAVYELPDGRRFRTGPEAFTAPELLFQPQLDGLDCPSVHEALAGAVFRCDIELRKQLWGAVLLAGGTTTLPGFARRLLKEGRALAPTGTKLRIIAPSKRDMLAWTGGSILASLSTFRSTWVSRAQWEEEGADRIVHKLVI